MADFSTAASGAHNLWIRGDWRCEVDANGRLRLYHGSTLISRHQPNNLDHIDDYAAIWRAAIAELPDVSDGTNS